jgi:glycosyltransferase involved in cell wall biosynthesis
VTKVPSVIFVLPVRGANGGANSVVQEALGLSELGVRCAVAVDAKNWDAFSDNYPELVGKNVVLRSYDSPGALAELMRDRDVAIATNNVSVTEVLAALDALSSQERAALKLGYYVQDYEPLFFHPESERWRVAHASYGALKEATLFAKTKWLCDIVYLNHGIRVRKVIPSIDHDIYYPDLSLEKDCICVGAMLRVKTARRAPQRTARILHILRDTVPRKIVLQVFGSTDDELESAGIATSDGIVNHGRLKRTEVPAFMRGCDLFLDLSDFQAFGRTGLEAMASGCIPLVPALGGTAEYAIHGKNAFVVDTRSDRDILDAVGMFLNLPDRERRTMQQAALETAANFSIRKAALSELRLFQEMCWQDP